MPSAAVREKGERFSVPNLAPCDQIAIGITPPTCPSEAQHIEQNYIRLMTVIKYRNMIQFVKLQFSFHA
jgi:hypothetical protein